MEATLPSSPSKFELQQEKRKSGGSSFFSSIKERHTLNALRWGFSIGTMVTFLAMYHTRGDVLKAVMHGTAAGLVVLPLKHHMYMRTQKSEFFRAIDVKQKNTRPSLPPLSKRKTKQNKNSTLRLRAIQIFSPKTRVPQKWLAVKKCTIQITLIREKNGP